MTKNRIDNNSTLTIRTAPVFQPLLKPARYKAAWGGRGTGKSHFFAGKAVQDCIEHKGMLIVCIREVQKDLKQSAKRLIETKLVQYRLGEAEGFPSYIDRIATTRDGLIIFPGL